MSKTSEESLQHPNVWVRLWVTRASREADRGVVKSGVVERGPSNAGGDCRQGRMSVQGSVR